MISITNKVFIYFFSILLLVATGAYAYWQEAYLLLLPFGLLAVVFLIQHPAFLLYVLLISIPWSVQLNLTPEMALNFPDEPLMLLAAFTGLCFLILYRKKPVGKVILHPLIFLLAVQLLWTLVTVFTSANFVFSAKYILAKSWYLGAFVLTPLFLFTNEKILNRSAIVLLVSMLSFMCLALLKHSQNTWTFEKINDAVVPFFVNHVDYSALLVFMLPVLVAMVKLSPGRQLKVILTCILIITLAAIYFSYARGAWLALAAGTVSYWLIKKKALFLSFLLFMLISVSAVLWLSNDDRYLKFSNDYQRTIFHTNFREHLVATYQLKDVSTAERFHRWVAGVRMIRDSWKTGLGPSTFYQQYKSYTVPSFRTWVSRNEEQSTVHNYFLLMIIEQGLPGLGLFVLLVGTLFWYAQKIYHRTTEKLWKIAMAAVGSILVMQCVINFLSDMIETDKVGSIFYLCIATIIAADIKTRKEVSNSAANIQGIAQTIAQ